MRPLGEIQTDFSGRPPIVTVGRPETDFYRTPPWLVEAVLPPAIGARRVRRVLDAGAGDGRLALAVDRHVRQSADAPELVLVESAPDWAAWLRTPEALCPDATVVDEAFETWALEAADRGELYDVVITNPPYRHWEAWVHLLLPLIHRDGLALILAFANVLGTSARAKSLWRARPPARLWWSPRRASFTAQGSPRESSVWFEWSGRPAYGPPMLHWLDT